MPAKDLLTAIAQEANFVPADARRVEFHVAAVTQVNRTVADAALTRVSIDHSPQSYDTLRAQHADRKA
jgi:hypothetical protein